MLSKFNQKLANVLIFLTLLALSISNLYPLFYMFMNSIKSRTDYYVNPFSVWGLKLTSENYLTMISQFKILNLFKNSFIISLFSIILLLCFGIFASYAFAKINFRGRNIIYLLVISTLFIPVQATIIPLYVLFSKVHLVNTYWSVIFMYVGMFLPEVILLMTSTFRGIPDEMIEAAKLDGAGYFDIIRYVIIPMGRPAIILCVIFYYIVTWNDLFTPMILLQSMDRRTVMVALAALLSRYSGDPTFQFAGLVLASIPAILVYAIFQRYIIKGISLGATK
ncbi:MAG TPA: carbohydrate ABC transporter permease [Anaerolineales bacterium]|nr:carbohydrate ABC transporter permease [Anaerolineales bacterium]